MIRPKSSVHSRAAVRKQAVVGKAQVVELVVEQDADGNYIVPDWTTYRLLVSQTESQPALWSAESKANLRTVHHLMGVVSEIDELFDPVEGLAIPSPNWDEEIGDLLWYLASLVNVAHDQGWPTTIVEDTGLWEEVFEEADKPAYLYRGIKKEQSELLDTAKRLLAYGDGSLNRSLLMSQITRVTSLIASCATLIGIGTDLPHLAKLNITKLRKRYTTGFNATEAVNRKLAEEAELFRSAAQGTTTILGASLGGCSSCNDPWGKGEGNASV